MHDIVHELDVAATPEAVYEAVTTPAGVAGWFTRDCDVPAEVGGTATFGFEDHTTVFEMAVDLLEPPELVHWNCTGGPDEWVGTTIAFRIEGRGDGATVRFWHGGWEYEDGLLPRASFQWAMYLDSLRRYVETGTGSPQGG